DDAVAVLLDRIRCQAEDAVAHVERLALLRHVAQPYQEVGVLERRTYEKRRGERADDGQVLNENGARVGEDVVAVLPPSLVFPTRGSEVEPGAAYRRRRVVRVVVVVIVPARVRGLGAERAPPAQVPVLGLA